MSVESRAAQRVLSQLASLLLAGENWVSVAQISLFLVRMGVSVTAQSLPLSCPRNLLGLILLIEKKSENLPRYVSPTSLVALSRLSLEGSSREMWLKLEGEMLLLWVVTQSVWGLLKVGWILFVARWQLTLLMARLLGTRFPVLVNSLLLGILIVEVVVSFSVR